LAQTIAEEADGVVATRALVFVAGLAGIMNPPEQITLLRRAVQVTSTPGDVRPALIAALREGGELVDLAKELETRLSENLEDDERRTITEELRDLYRDDLDDPERSARMGRRLMDLSPDSDTARDSYEAQLRDLERWPELVEHLVRRADATADTEEANTLRLEAAGIAEEYLDDARRAVRIADSVLAADEGSVRALELRARALAGLGRWKEHIDSLERLVAVSEPDAAARVYAQAADVYEHQLAYSDRALKMWEAAGEADPSYGTAFAQQARLASETGDPDLAFTKWTVACEKLEGTELADGLVNLAQTAQLSGNDAEVVAILLRATELDPRNALAKSAYEDALLDAGDVDAIMRLLDSELESAPPEEMAHIYLRRAAIQFFDLHKEADALKSIDAASEAGVGRAAAALKGDIHLVAGRWEECVAAYRLALGDDDTLDPTTLAPRALLPGEDPDRHAATTVFLFRAGYASEAAGRYSDAQDLYGSANLDDDTFAPASVGLARLAVRQGNLDSASIYIADYRQSGPGDPELDAEIEELAKRVPR
jgi:tetratricopeptide (TPR) repeat protein